MYIYIIYSLYIRGNLSFNIILEVTTNFILKYNNLNFMVINYHVQINFLRMFLENHIILQYGSYSYL